MLNKPFNFVIKHPILAAVIALIISLLGISNGTSLPIRLSISDLLPDQRESVVDMKSVAQEVGGVGYFIIMIGPTKNAIQHLPKVANIFKGSSDIKYLFYERGSYLIQDKALYLLTKKKFKKLEKHIKTLFSKRRRSI